MYPGTGTLFGTWTDLDLAAESQRLGGSEQDRSSMVRTVKQLMRVTNLALHRRRMRSGPGGPRLLTDAGRDALLHKTLRPLRRLAHCGDALVGLWFGLLLGRNGTQATSG